MSFAEKIKVVFSDVWEWIKPIVVIVMTTAGKELMNAAVVAVQNAAQSGLSNSDKRRQAYNSVITQMDTAGRQVGESAINMAIELALQKIKAGA